MKTNILRPEEKAHNKPIPLTEEEVLYKDINFLYFRLVQESISNRNKMSLEARIELEAYMRRVRAVLGEMRPYIDM